MTEVTEVIEPQDETSEDVPQPSESPAEPSPDEDEDEEQDEEQAEQSPEARESQAEIDKKVSKLRQSATTWRNRVSTVLEEDAQFLVSCELCEPDIPGYHWPAEVMQPASELHARLIGVLTSPATPELVPDPNTATCPDCKGWGETLTGSRKVGQEKRACSTCNGFGYTQSGGAIGAGQIAAPSPVPPLPLDPESPMLRDADDWGHPRLLDDGQPNPNFGRFPQFVDPSYP